MSRLLFISIYHDILSAISQIASDSILIIILHSLLDFYSYSANQ